MSIRHVSKKQEAKNKELAKIKSKLAPFCVLCGKPANDLAHLLPKSCYPEYYTHPDNVVMLCRDCHNKYDNDIDFRRRQVDLIDQAIEVDELAAIRYFNL